MKCPTLDVKVCNHNNHKDKIMVKFLSKTTLDVGFVTIATTRNGQIPLQDKVSGTNKFEHLIFLKLIWARCKSTFRA